MAPMSLTYAIDQALKVVHKTEFTKGEKADPGILDSFGFFGS